MGTGYFSKDFERELCTTHVAARGGQRVLFVILLPRCYQDRTNQAI